MIVQNVRGRERMPSPTETSTPENAFAAPFVVEDVVTFPNINNFPESHPGPYERQMGGYIGGLLRAFAGHVPEAESNTRVLELAATPGRWSAGHAVFDEIRHRLLAAIKAKDEPREWQYSFEESCCQALYNATEPPDPFDPSSAFFVVAQALGLARAVGVPLEAVGAVFASEA